MKTKIFLIASLLFFTALQAKEPKGKIDKDKMIPLEITAEGLITVTVTVSDSIQGRFILDTGGGLNVLSNALLRRIHSVPDGRFTGFRHTGERIDLDIYRIRSLNIDGHYQNNPVVASLALLDSLKIDGILSLKFFEKMPFTLDLKDSALYFESGASLEKLLKKGRYNFLKVDDERSVSLDAFTDLMVNDSLSLQCILDTGSPSTYLDARFADRIGIDTASSDVKRRTRRNSFGAVETEYIASVKSLSLKDIPFSERRGMKIFFLNQMIYDGLIGMDFLKGNKITFDLPGRRIIFDEAGN